MESGADMRKTPCGTEMAIKVTRMEGLLVCVGALAQRGSRPTSILDTAISELG